MWLSKKIKRFFSMLELKKLSKIHNIIFALQEFYLNKNLSDNREEMYKKAREELSILGITRIEVTKRALVITLLHPGLFIGRHGDNITALQEFFLKKNINKKIEIEEEKILGWLLPYDYSQEELY